VRNSVIRHATADGIFATSNATVDLASNLIVQNAGAGIRGESGSTVSAINNTIDGNARGVDIDGAMAILTNNLITNSAWAGVRASGGATADLSFNDLFNPSASNGDYEGLDDQTGQNGNISADPLYVDRDNLDYGLQDGSPPIDAGTSEGAPVSDMLDRLRYDSLDVPDTGGGLYPYYDMGAIEFGGAPPVDIDLAAGNVVGPTSGPQDGTVTITWAVGNLGPDDAAGSWYDGIYISADATWSPNDRFLGAEEHTGGLAAGDSYDAEATIHVQGVIPGSYYFIVKADARHETYEGATLENNWAASADMVEFTMPELEFGVPLDADFTDTGEAHYYLVNVPSGYNLQVSLDDADNQGSNELYIAFGTPPAPGSVQSPYSSFGGADQQVFVPAASPGAWYILAYSAYVPGSGDYTILSEVSVLDLTDVTPDRIGNAAPITLTLTGAGFASGATVELIAPDSTTYTAGIADVDSFTQITAFFAAGAIPAGLYTVRVSDPGGSAELEDSFAVVAGGATGFDAQVIVPSVLGYHQLATIYVEYENTGDLAMAAPLLLLTAVQDGEESALMTLDRSLLTQGFWTSAVPEGFGNMVQILASGEVPGLLQPGESGRVPVYWAGWLQPWDYSYPPFEFNLGVIATDNTTLIDWTSLGQAARPPYIGEEPWQVIWDNLTLQVGDTWGDYVTMLDDNAFYLGRLGENVSDVSDLLALEMQQANGYGPMAVLASSVDMVVPAPGLSLRFARTFPNSIPTRFRMGPLGRGWSHSWELHLVELADGTVQVVSPGLAGRVFQPDSRGGYFCGQGSYAELTKEANGSFLLMEQRGGVSAFQADGRLDYLEDDDGNRITCGYTGDWLTSLVHSSGQAMQIEYNGAGRIERIVDGQSRETVFTYDAQDEHLLSVEDPDGQVFRYTYEIGAGAASLHSLLSVEYPDGPQDYFGYNERGWLVSAQQGGGDVAVVFSYGPSGSVEVTTAEGEESTFFYDHRGLLVKSTDPLDNTFQVAFNDSLLPTAITDPAGRLYTAQYDEYGNQTVSTNPLGQTVRYHYADPFGRIASMTDSRGGAVGFSYDARGNVVSITYDDGTTEGFSYDALGNISSWVNRRGQTVEYAYDADGRVLTRSYPDGPDIEYTYDALGNLTQVVDLSGTTVMTYDADRLLTRVDYPGDPYLEFAYDDLGRLVSTVDELGNRVEYVSGTDGRLEGLTDGSGGDIVLYDYDDQGRVTREDYGNGTYATYEYDDAGALVTLSYYLSDGTTVSRYDYTYDASSRVVAVSGPDGTWTYEYDAVGQLTHAVLASTNPSIPDQDIRYTYDAAGNRTQVVVNGDTIDYSTNTMNQYTTVGERDYSYDADGNLIEVVGPEGITTYGYDYENRLVAIDSPSADWSFTYDAFGNLVATTRDGVTTRYVIDPTGPGNLAGVYDGAGNPVANYVHGLGLVAQHEAGGQMAYYGYDALGNAVHLTDGSASVANRYSYSPFGVLLDSSETIPNMAQFVGAHGVLDIGCGLYRMGARWYDPALGRFIQPDPIGLAGQDPNLYRYVVNSPVTLTDPVGLGVLPDPFYLWRSMPQLVYPEHMNSLLKTVGWEPYRFQLFWGWFHFAKTFNTSIPDAAGRWHVAFGRWHVYADRVVFPRVPNPDGFKDYKVVQYSPLAAAAWTYLNQPAWAWLATGGKAVVAGKVALLGLWGYGWYRAGRWASEATGADWVATEMWDFVNWTTGGYLFHAANWVGNLFGGAAGSADPNQKLGPAGFGVAGFIAPDGLLPYRVDFENEEDATAPAQVVTVTDQLDGDLNWSTFEFTEFGFADQMIAVPDDAQHFSTAVPMSYGGVDFEVQINAGLDLQTGEVSVGFYSIDPGTGLPPSVDIGFLPPEDGTGRGMGYFSYVIELLPGLTTGTEIRNVAEITFDFGETIATNQVDPHDPSQGTDPAKECLNTIDVGTPSSYVLSLPTKVTSATFDVQWAGQDDLGGSGIGSYDIYVSTDGGGYALWLEDTEETSAAFTGEHDRTYAFYSVATDNVGHVESPPVLPDSSTLVDVGAVLIESRSLDGAQISIYDIEPANGQSSPGIAWSWGEFVYGQTDVVVDTGFLGDQLISLIMLFGDGTGTADLGIEVTGNAGLASLIDARTNPQSLGFLASDGYVGTVSLGAGITGAVLDSGQPPTAIYSGDYVRTVIAKGDVDGNLVIDGDLTLLQVLGGDLNGDVTLTGSNVGTVMAIAMGGQGGSINGGIMTPNGNVNTVMAIGGGISGSIQASTGSVGTVMAINGAITSPTIYGQTGVNLVQAITGGVASSITSGASLGTVMAINGDLDLTGGRSISAGSTINALMAINGDILGDGVTSPDIYVGNGNLSSLMAIGGGMQSVWVDVNGAGPSSGRLGSVSVGGSVSNSRFEADGLLPSLFALGDFTNSSVQAGSLSVVYVRGTISEDSSDGDEDEIHADTGSYFVIDSTKFSQITPTAFDSFSGVTASVA